MLIIELLISKLSTTRMRLLNLKKTNYRKSENYE